MERKRYRFVTKEGDFAIATSPEFIDIKGRDEQMDNITLWFKMNAERYKVISDVISIKDDDPIHRIIRFMDREQYNKERVFTYHIEEIIN